MRKILKRLRNASRRNAGTQQRRHAVLARALEPLESRRLFSVINVANFGVNSNDASGAIQAAFNASQPGDTILFPAGTYRFGHQLTIPGNRTLQGNNAVLIAPNAAYCFQNDQFGNANNLKLTGFEVKGRFIRLDSWAGWSSNIEIANNRFDPFNFGSDGSPEKESIFISNGGRNINIHNNTANGTWGDGWVVGYGFQNVNISDNVIENMAEGIHYLGHYDPSDGLTIARNIFQNNHLMNIEVQGEGANVLVEQNLLQGANLYPNYNDNENTFGFSLAGTGMTNTIVRRNKIVSYERPDGDGLREGLELAGIGVQAYENDIEGTDMSIVLNTSQNGQVYNNRIVGAREGAGAFQGRSPGANLYNNGSNVSLDWNYANFSLPNAGAQGSSATSSAQVAVPTSSAGSTATSTSTPAGTWSVINGQAALGGVIDQATRGVVSVFEASGKWYQVNTANQVWTLSGGSELNVTGKVSPSGSSSSSQTATSTSTGPWTVINGKAALNGVIDQGSRGVVRVFAVNGKWYQLNSANQVWTLPGNNALNVTGQVTPPG